MNLETNVLGTVTHRMKNHWQFAKFQSLLRVIIVETRRVDVMSRCLDES